MLGKSDLLALADAGKIKLSAEESVFMSFEMIRLAYPKDMIDRAKSGIASGAWQQKTSFSNSRALSKDNLLSSALDSDRVDLFLFLIESGYLEGVAKSGWKTTIDQLKPLSIVAHAAHCGAGRIVQTLARVPSLASHFTSLSQEEKDWILAPSKSASHEVWRGLWEGGVDPFISDSNGQTLLHHVVADKDRVAKIPLIQDLLRRAPGIEESKTNQGETIWEVAEAAVKRLISTHGSYYVTDQQASLEKLRTTIDESRIRRNISDRRPRKKKSFSRGL